MFSSGACLSPSSSPSEQGGHRAQAMLADDIIILLEGPAGAGEGPDEHATSAHRPGPGERPFRASPGAGRARARGAGPEGRFARACRPRDVLSAASSDGEAPRPGPRPRRIAPPATRPAEATPLYGPLDVPDGDDEGPPDGLTLDMAIERLVAGQLRAPDQVPGDPQGPGRHPLRRARANPLVFASADGVPYGNYSPRRPGENSYSVVLIQPVDVNRKRLVRVARRRAGEEGPRGPVPGRRPARDRQPLHGLRRCPGRPRDGPLRPGEPRRA